MRRVPTLHGRLILSEAKDPASGVNDPSSSAALPAPRLLPHSVSGILTPIPVGAGSQLLLIPPQIGFVFGFVSVTFPRRLDQNWVRLVTLPSPAPSFGQNKTASSANPPHAHAEPYRNEPTLQPARAAGLLETSPPPRPNPARRQASSIISKNSKADNILMR